MEVRMHNPTTVTRIWSEDVAGELIGVFQYSGDASNFAKLAAADETKPSHVYYVVAHHYDGRITIVRPEPKQSAKAA